MVKTLISASAKGIAKDARTPTAENSMVPATRRHDHPLSHLIPAGTASSWQTMESSSTVLVIEKNSPEAAHTGTGSLGANRQMTKGPGRRSEERRVGKAG